MAQPPKRFPYIKTVRARGRTYEYFDTGTMLAGKKVYNRLPPRSDKSWGQVYAGMVAARHARQTIVSVPTVAEISRVYQASDRFRKRSESTQVTYLIYLRQIETHLGMAPVSAVEKRDIKALMATMKDRPGAANMTLLVLRNLFKLAIAEDHIATDPSKGIEELEGEEAEHEPWPLPLLEEALQDPEVRLPVALLYYTAQRIGDVCKMRWSDIRDGYLFVKQQKTRKELDLRIHSELAAILAQTPREAMTILYGPNLRPRRAGTLRDHLQAWARKRGQHVVPHGLRKNAVIALLQMGCSLAETSSMSGQSLRIVEHYAKRRNNRKLSSAAVLRWQGTDGGNGKQEKIG